MPADVTASSISIGGYMVCLIGSTTKPIAGVVILLGSWVMALLLPAVRQWLSPGAIPAGVTFKVSRLVAAFLCALGSNDKTLLLGDNTYAAVW